MKWFAWFFDRLFVVVGALTLVQAPLYMHEYSQRLAGHVSELHYQLGKTQHAAEQSGKTLEQYIQKFIGSSDLDFSLQGKIMHAMVQRSQNLSDSLNAIENASVLSRPFVFLAHVDLDIAKGTLAAFHVGIPLTIEGIIYALLGIAMGYCLYRIFHRIIRGLFRLFTKKKAKAAA